ncbi:MAG: hypothetical protein V1816_06850 [Pseudomonadota bacterium]
MTTLIKKHLMISLILTVCLFCAGCSNEGDGSGFVPKTTNDSGDIFFVDNGGATMANDDFILVVSVGQAVGGDCSGEEYKMKSMYYRRSGQFGNKALKSDDSAGQQ